MLVADLPALIWYLAHTSARFNEATALCILSACDVAAVDVEGTVLLAEIVEALVVGSPYRLSLIHIYFPMTRAIWKRLHVILKNWRKLKETWRMQRLRKKPLLVSIRLLRN